jgi:hypothetical protein
MENESNYMICIKNENYPASLEFGKVYRVLADAKAEKHKMLRVIDESGEDYLYPENYFVAITLPPLAQDAFMALR